MTYPYKNNRTTVTIAFVKHLLYLIFTTTLLVWCYYYTHFTEEESETERSSIVPKVVESKDSEELGFNPRKHGSRTSIINNVL